MDHRAKHRQSELSGGEQQRIAIARALSNFPEIIIADEPTGNLDENTGREIIDLILNLADQNNMSLLIATHDPFVASSMDKVLKLENGKLIKIKVNFILKYECYLQKF